MMAPTRWMTSLAFSPLSQNFPGPSEETQKDASYLKRAPMAAVSATRQCPLSETSE